MLEKLHRSTCSTRSSALDGMFRIVARHWLLDGVVKGSHDAKRMLQLQKDVESRNVYLKLPSLISLTDMSAYSPGPSRYYQGVNAYKKEDLRRMQISSGAFDDVKDADDVPSDPFSFDFQHFDEAFDEVKNEIDDQYSSKHFYPWI